MAYAIPAISRGSVDVTLLAATALVTTTTSAKFQVECFDEITYAFIVSAASGTSPTMTIRIQKLLGDLSTWTDIATTATFTTTGTKEIHLGRANSGSATQANSVSAAASTLLDVPLGAWHRIVYTIGGTNPSFTTAAYCTPQVH